MNLYFVFVKTSLSTEAATAGRRNESSVWGKAKVQITQAAQMLSCEKLSVVCIETATGEYM